MRRGKIFLQSWARVGYREDEQADDDDSIDESSNYFDNNEDSLL